MSATETENDAELEIVEAVARALGDLPIIQQLNFVESLLLTRGADKTDYKRDPVLVTAAEAVRSVMAILEKHPEAAKLTMND